MKFLVITANPKSVGRCRAITDKIIEGAKAGGAEVTEVNVNTMPRCKVCGDGWGTCRDKDMCAFGGDGFDEVRNLALEADAIAMTTPVYWQEVSEGMKSFIDRMRRCDKAAMKKPDAKSVVGTPVLLAVSAGGSGRGTIQSLEQLERFCSHVGMPIFDYLSQNRWNEDYTQEAAYAAAKAMASGRKPGDTL